MDDFRKRRSRLRYLISVNQGTALWVDSVRLDVNSITILANAGSMLALGESLSLLRPTSLTRYLEECIACMKNYLTVTQPKQKFFSIFSGKQKEGMAPQLPFSLDSRTVFIALCQVFVTVYQSIEQLSKDPYSASDEDLYLKLHDLINVHIVKVGLTSLERHAQNMSDRDRLILKGH